MKKALLCAFAIIAAFPSMAKNKEQISITCEDGNKLKILVYRPETVADSLATGVLWIHGGGYITRMASMAGMMGMGPILVKKHGCIVISPEYRLGKKGRFPNALNDCYASPARQKDYSSLPPAYTFVCTAEPFYCETLSFVENLFVRLE